MTTYLVLKRSRGDGWMPGDVLVDPLYADRLVQRGFIHEVPDDYEKKLPKAKEKGEKLNTKVEANQEKEITKEGEAALLEQRPEAKKLAKAMDVELDEIFALSDEDYAEGVEAFLTKKDGGSDDSDDEPPKVIDLSEVEAEETEPDRVPGQVPDVSIGGVAPDKPAKGE